jgi:hypothetical protein
VLELSALLAGHPSGHVVVCLLVVDRNYSHSAPPLGKSGTVALVGRLGWPVIAPPAEGLSDGRGAAVADTDPGDPSRGPAQRRARVVYVELVHGALLAVPGLV